MLKFEEIFIPTQCSKYQPNNNNHNNWSPSLKLKCPATALVLYKSQQSLAIYDFRLISAIIDLQNYRHMVGCIRETHKILAASFRRSPPPPPCHKSVTLNRTPQNWKTLQKCYLAGIYDAFFEVNLLPHKLYASPPPLPPFL